MLEKAVEILRKKLEQEEEDEIINQKIKRANKI